MRDSIRCMFSLLLAAVMLFTFAGCSRREEDTGAGRPFSASLPGDPGCLDPQFTENENALLVIRNTMEGLLRFDADGNPVPAGASGYTVSEDGKSYLFSLRENSYWFAASRDPERPERVTSRDYVFAFRRLVDPEMRSPYAEDYRCIQNAADIISGKRDPSYLGVSAPDGNSVLFELEYPNPEFPKLLARTCAVPCNQAFFESTKGRYGLDDSMVLCNGAFYLTKWNYDQYSGGNFLTMKKSPVYHDPDDVFPNSLQFTILHGREAADADYAQGNTDVLVTDVWHDGYLHNKEYTVTAKMPTTMGLIFNPENELLQSVSLREALACGIDRSALEYHVSEDTEIAYGLVPPAVTVLGSSYRSVQADEPLCTLYAPDKASRLFSEAAEGLGLGTMNSVRVMVPSTIKDTEALLAMCQNWQELFGYYIGIETVSPDEYRSRLAAGDYSIALYAVTPEYDGCYAAMKAYADRAELFGLENRYFGKLVEGLARPVNLADAASLCAEAEKTLIGTYMFIPLFYKNRYLIATAGNKDIVFDPFTGTADFIGAKYLPD
ncbi:MAG: peptide ABC transporter substrate-binding protein [Oscillospiraceae bacterium]|nr:peptide ABC transporter substrate-binding protein [Oscillospiraceae bacterium]